MSSAVDKDADALAGNHLQRGAVVLRTRQKKEKESKERVTVEAQRVRRQRQAGERQGDRQGQRVLRDVEVGFLIRDAEPFL